jgi:hypothetical protein
MRMLDFRGVASDNHWLCSGAYRFLLFCIMMVVDFFLVLFYYPETASISLERMQHHLVR